MKIDKERGRADKGRCGEMRTRKEGKMLELENGG